MNISIEDIDINRLRNDLIDYYGTASLYSPQAVIDLSKVENASPYELVMIAINNNFNLENSINQSKLRRNYERN